MTSYKTHTTRKSKLNKLIKFDSAYDIPIIGTDEAGRGPAAGPVYACAVYFPKFSPKIKKALKYIDDSKKFSSNPKLRKELSEEIKQYAKYAIAQSSVAEIEKINILQASLKAMRESCQNLQKELELGGYFNTCPKILVDGKFIIPNYKIEQEYVIKGDSKSVSIAAASIIAKVERDELMINLAKKHPQYSWESNKGYLSKAHIEAIKEHGPCKWHRMSFLTGILQGKLF